MKTQVIGNWGLKTDDWRLVVARLMAGVAYSLQPTVLGLASTTGPRACLVGAIMCIVGCNGLASYLYCAVPVSVQIPVGAGMAYWRDLS